MVRQLNQLTALHNFNQKENRNEWNKLYILQKDLFVWKKQKAWWGSLGI